MRRQIAFLMTALAVAGCDDERSAAGVTAPPVPRDGASVAYLTVSDAAGSVTSGNVVTVTAIVRESSAASTVGAFTAALKYDPAGLRFAGEQEIATGGGGGMRALNPREGEIRAAGASPEGFSGGQLFAVKFTVVDPAALESLRLDVTELSSVGFDNRLSTLQVHRRYFTAPRR